MLHHRPETDPVFLRVFYALIKNLLMTGTFRINCEKYRELGEFFNYATPLVGIVAGLVKVANGQTDRLAQIFVAQRPLRAHWGSSESLRAQRPLRGLSCDEDHCFSFAGTTTGNKRSRDSFTPRTTGNSY